MLGLQSAAPRVYGQVTARHREQGDIIPKLPTKFQLDPLTLVYAGYVLVLEECERSPMKAVNHRVKPAKVKL